MKNTQKSNFDDIRSLFDSEVSDTIQELLHDDHFRASATPVIQPMSWEQLSEMMNSCKSIADFQQRIIHPFMRQLIDKTTTEMKGVSWENFTADESHVFISNHRDIILDAGFLNILLIERGLQTSEIAIGDNLLIYPWITRLVRLNKSFMVKREVGIRNMLETSQHLSQYIFDTIQNRDQSVWIAQREGRAKDSNDKTQTSLLKMLTLYNNAHPIEALAALRVVPLSITYEFDPCDYLKAKEFQLKRDNPHHKKSPQDDLENMMTGIFGFKGRTYFQFGKPINKQLLALDENLNRTEKLNKAAELIDKEIYKNYVFFPSNYIAYDQMTNGHRFASQYTRQDEEEFNNYLEKQIQKVEIKDKDIDFLKEKIVEMYGNTVKNFLSV